MIPTRRASRETFGAGVANHEIPDDMVCPISFELMKDPVMAQDGHTCWGGVCWRASRNRARSIPALIRYERVCIEEWLSRSRTSPQTNEPLEHAKLTPNRMAKSQISDFLDERRELKEALG